MRRLTKDEDDLWNRLRETVKPLRKRIASKAVKAEAPEPAPPAASKKPARAAPPASTPAAKKAKPASPPALAPFEEKTLRRLGRGLVAVDDRIDLHGMRQERAYHALAAFLRHAQARGHKLVLVVTGKGKTGDANAGEETRGVLKQVVPTWLSRDDFREFVVGFDDANRRHGGAGALYVRIRRRRAVGRPP